jgi:hypothetical protein
VRYVQERVPLAEARGLVESSGLSKDEAELDICRAIADRKIRLRCQVIGVQAAGGLPNNLYRWRIPSRLTPQDFNWEDSLTIAPWPVDTQYMFQIHPRATRPNQRIYLSVELSTSDVRRVLYGGRSPSQPANEDSGRVPSTSATESVATKALASQLRDNPDLKKADAKNWCASAGYQLGARGFQSRVWPKARTLAGLPAIGSPGRKQRKSHTLQKDCPG